MWTMQNPYTYHIVEPKQTIQDVPEMCYQWIVDVSWVHNKTTQFFVKNIFNIFGNNRLSIFHSLHII